MVEKRSQSIRGKDSRSGVPAPSWRRRLTLASTKLLFPEVCASCGVSGAWICDECARTIRGVNQTRACGRCGHPEGHGLSGCTYCDHWIEPAALQVRSVFEFSGAIRESIHKMKYSGEYARSEWHGVHMASLLSELGWTPDVLVAVPLHPKRQRARGYNQSQKLAEVMGHNLDLPVIPGLRRLRDTPQQARLGMEERRTNVAGAFRANQSLSGLRVLLVDDVTTTRSTLLECSSACLDDGATLVQGVTLATDV